MHGNEMCTSFSDIHVPLYWIWFLTFSKYDHGENVCIYVCMNGCIEVSLRGVPMERGVNWAWGRGPSKVGPIMPQPAGTIGPASCMLTYTCTLCVLSVANFTLGSQGWSVASCRKYRTSPGP